MSAVSERFASSRRAAETFFGAHADAIARACRALAARFDRGARLVVVGEGVAASDAHHVAVEFVHPILVGKQALPALAITAPAGHGVDAWTTRLRALLRADDILLVLTHGRCPEALARAVDAARGLGALTIGMSGGAPAGASGAEYAFVVPDDDPLVVQEVQETAYHVLWELVHVFLRGPERCAPEEERCTLCGDDARPAVVLALDERAGTAVVSMDATEREVAMDLVEARVGDTVLVHQGFAIAAVGGAPEPIDPERALYPFLYDDVPPHPPTAAPAAGADALAEARASTLEKCRDVVALREAIRAEYDAALGTCAARMADRFHAGGALVAFGNGGSATDADDAAADCLLPAHADWRALPALSLTADAAVLSAIANDVGYENVFARQVIAYGGAGDVALGISTSGNSSNVLAALREAKRRGMLTVALSGNDGGEMASPGVVDFCFVARSAYTPRIQEGQATVWHTLLDLVQRELRARRRPA